MKKVIYIEKEVFERKFQVKEIDLVRKGLFTQEDIIEIDNIENRRSFLGKTYLLLSYTPFIIRNPRFLVSFVFPNAFDYYSKIFGIKKKIGKNRGMVLRKKQPIQNCILKASIARAFKPGRLLEIGTYLGWGAASFKKAIPSCEVYTMNLRVDKASNNTIEVENIGSFYKKKGLAIKQIWADSTKYDYSKLPPIDIVYVDGSHQYNDVYKDLENASQIAKKCVILDDYVPGTRYDMVFGPWNENVVRATNNFLKSHPCVFSKAYWIINTPFCVLVK